MRTYEPGKVSVCLVNYKTEELTRLCLRSIKKYTHRPYEVIVVDNDSGDKSLDYLRSVPWIRLIERPGQVAKSGSWAHGTALDLGLGNATGEFFLAMHSDTIVHKDGWLEELLAYFDGDPEMACAGSGKLDLKPKWEVMLKRFTDVKGWWRKVMVSDKRKYKFYVRAICALYRTETLVKEKLGFAMSVDEGITCGKQLFFELVKRGYKTKVVPEHKMAAMVHHMAHATMVLNPEFKVRDRTEMKCQKKLKRLFESPEIHEIMNDASLDK